MLLIFLCMLSFINCVSAISIPKPTDQFYINDFANVLNQETKNFVFESSKLLDEKTTAQLVVVTVESMNGSNIDSYALQIGRDWNLGGEKKKNGIVILLAKSEKKVKVEVGDGLGGALNDGKVGNMIRDYAIPSFKNERWDDGIKNLYSALLSEIYKEYNLDVPEGVSSQTNLMKNKLFRYSMVSIVGLIIWLLFFRRSNWNNRGGPGGVFFGGFGGGFGGGSSGGGFSGGGGGSGFSGGGSSGDF